MDEEVGEAVPMGRTCAWCSAAAPVDATRCPSCGAALAQRESIGGLRIPGVTDIPAELLDADGRPLHIPGASSAQGMASTAIVAAAMGGPIALAALGGMAAVSAAEYVAASRGGGVAPDLDHLGQPSDAAARLAEQLDRDGERGPDAPPRPAPVADPNDPWRDLDR